VSGHAMPELGTASSRRLAFWKTASIIYLHQVFMPGLAAGWPSALLGGCDGYPAAGAEIAAKVTFHRTARRGLIGRTGWCGRFFTGSTTALPLRVS
jgi:hypothetical protein